MGGFAMTARCTGLVRVDRGIPLPLPAKRGRTKWPWATMAVGDSFFAPGYRTNSADGRDDLPAMAISRIAGRFPGTEWAARAVVEAGVSGVRVWRTK